MEAIVRFVSTYTRAAVVGFGARGSAGRTRPRSSSAEQLAPTARDCCKKRRRFIGTMSANLPGGKVMVQLLPQSITQSFGIPRSPRENACSGSLSYRSRARNEGIFHRLRGHMSIIH